MVPAMASTRMMVAVLLALTPACVWQTRETFLQATFGVDRPRTVALVIVEGDLAKDRDHAIAPPLVDAFRWRLGETGVVDIVAERKVPELPTLPALCELGAAVAAETGTPIEQLVTLSTVVSFEPVYECSTFGGSEEDNSTFVDRLDDDYVGPGCKTHYSHGVGRASATLAIVDLATCTYVRTAGAQLEAELRSGDREGSEIVGRESIIASFAAKRAQPLAEQLYPVGLEVSPTRADGPRDPSRLDVTGAGADRLLPGVRYLVRGSRTGRRTAIGHVRVVATSTGGVTVTTDPPRLEPVLGDEVVVESHAHEWRVVPVLTVGDLVADARSTVLAGYGLAARWAYPRFHVTAEALISHQELLDFDGTRTDVGLGFGAWHRLGPIAPYLIAEAGVAFLPRLRAGDTTYFHSKGFYGLGAGLELSIGRYLLVVDVRLRRATGLAEGSMELPERYRQRTLQLGFGKRF